MQTRAIKTLIRDAFADTPHPGDDRLVRSVGDEPDEVVELFRGRHQWQMLPADFLDRAGAASPSALSFFSAGAFRFYLPAYLIADLDGELRYTEPSFYLFHGLDAESRSQTVRLPGGETTTWWDVQQDHLAGFTTREAAAIVAYLRWRAEHEETEPARRRVVEALESYWLARAGSGGDGDG